MAQIKSHSGFAPPAPEYRREESTVRCLSLLWYLTEAPATTTEAAELLGVCRRTIARDILALKRSGVEIKQVSRKRYYVTGAWWQRVAEGSYEVGIGLGGVRGRTDRQTNRQTVGQKDHRRVL